MSDGLFEIGFVPSSERYSYPTDKTIEIGNKNGSFKLSVSSDGGLVITTEKDVSLTCLNAFVTASQSVKVESPSIDIGGTGGNGVARIGDSVNPQTMKIETGSAIVRAL